ncbi:MAG TPA: tryptophanase [Verrucomicrobiae bacterium]|nr:tryptophanase [Verrucomicrobiae bacterium]
MNDSSGVLFSVPYEIAAVRPLRQTTLKERENALETAGLNTDLLPQDLIYIDLCTDSGVSAPSTTQIAAAGGIQTMEAAMGMAPEGSRAFASLSEQFCKVFGFPYLVPTTRGRAAERIWTKIHVKPGTVVPGNMLFPSTRMHIESNGATMIDVIGERAHDFISQDSFKGNVDLEKLAAVFREHGRDKVSCIYVELAVNACGGHPVALENLKETKMIAAANGVPLFLDASRILENSYLVRQRETGYQSRSIHDIARETCALADGCTMSALKDFLVPSGGMIGMRDLDGYRRAAMQSFLDGAQLSGSAMEMIATALREIFAAESYLASRIEQVDYLWRRLRGGIPLLHPPAGHAVFIDLAAFLPLVPAENHRAEALAAFVYVVSGIRLSKGPPPAPSQAARGADLLRLAVPARKYVQAHMDDVAEALLYAYAQRSEIKGLKQVEDPARSGYEPSRFTRL